MQFEVILGGVLVGIWEPWTLENHAKVYNCMHFQGLGLLVRSPVRDLLSERVWHAFCEILVPIGAPIGAPFGYFGQFFQGLILEAVLGGHKGPKVCRNGRGRRQGRGC